MATFVIAEAGSCHDNSFTKALRLIDAAKECGANAVKFQYWSSPGKLAARRGLGPEAKAVYERYQLPKSWLPELKKHADEADIEFMCTAYLIEDIADVEPFVKRFKVSAFESFWMEFINAHYQYGKPVVISRRNGYPILGAPVDLRFMWCWSDYPTQMEDVSLLAIRGWRGFSDHTTSVITGAMAVVLEAITIEKHFRLLDTSPECPDFGHSLVTFDFKQYVQNIREAERAL